PPVLDIEEAKTSSGTDEWQAIPLDDRVDLVLKWLTAFEEKLGLKPVIYTRMGFVKSHLGDAGQLTEYPLWVAHYTSLQAPSVPEGWPTWTFWQYSQSGQVAGIVGSVDLDKFNGSVSQLRALAGSAAPPGGPDPGNPGQS